jgi:hypothetical protein
VVAYLGSLEWDKTRYDNEDEENPKKKNKKDKKDKKDKKSKKDKKEKRNEEEDDFELLASNAQVDRIGREMANA